MKPLILMVTILLAAHRARVGKGVGTARVRPKY